MSGPESTAEALAREFAALNKATERAHKAIADMRAARAELRAEADEVRKLCRDMGAVTSKTAVELMGTEISRQLDTLMPEVHKALDQSVRKVNAKFDSFADLLLGKNEPDGKDLESLVAEARRHGGRLR